MQAFQIPPSDSLGQLERLARERILILDGAMGTQIQQLGLKEADFAGHGAGCACGCHPPAPGEHPQQGNNDLLNLTQPKAIEEIHYRYAKAGADIVETNTFSSTTIAQADYEKIKGNPDLTVVGHMTDAGSGHLLVDKQGGEHELTAQGWNAFPKQA